MPQDAAGRYETIQWLMFQMGGVGPMFGQVGFFHKFAGKDYEDKRPRDRYVGEAKRLLGVLDRHLAGRDWMMGDDLHDRRHRHFSVGERTQHVLRRRRAGGHQGLHAGEARARGVPGAPGGGARAQYSATAISAAQLRTRPERQT